MGIFSDGKKSNWVIVSHTWHVHSMGMGYSFLYDVTKKEAEAIAALKEKELNKDMYSSICSAIELPRNVVIVTRQKESL